MFSRARRLASIAVVGALALTGLSAAPASAVDGPTLTITSNLTVNYGETVSVPITYTGTDTGLVSAYVSINNGALDMATYINSHQDLVIVDGGATNYSITVIGTLAQINDFLANVKVHSRKNGFRESINVYSEVKAADANVVVDSASGHAYAPIYSLSLIHI